MYRWIVAIPPCPLPLVAKCTAVRVLKHTPTPVPKPVATAIHPALLSHPSNLWSLIFGAGLASVLLILVTLALLAIIVGVIWMFRTQRWMTTSSPVPYLEGEANGHSRSQGMTEVNPAHSMYSSPVSPLAREQMRMDYPPQQSALPVAPSGKDMAIVQTDMLQKPENPLKNKQWLDIAEGCAVLYDELYGLFPRSDPRRELATHVRHRLAEILTHSGVEFIARDHTYDIHRHRTTPPDSVAAPGTPIAKIISPGFAVGRRILLPARVQVVSTPVERADKEREDE